MQQLLSSTQQGELQEDLTRGRSLLELWSPPGRISLKHLLVDQVLPTCQTLPPPVEQVATVEPVPPPQPLPVSPLL